MVLEVADSTSPRDGPERITMEVDTSALETSGTRLPSPDFIKRRHERMRTRRASPTETDDDDATTFKSNVDSRKLKTNQEKEASKPEPIDTNEAANTKTGKTAIATASPTAIRSLQQLRAKRKSRVPGGAAAKLIGKAKTDDEFDDMKQQESKDDETVVAPPTEEFMKIRDDAKAAFEKGSAEPRRYTFYSSDASSSDSQPTPSQPASVESPTISKSSKNQSRVLNRNQVLHENSTAAVLSLLGGHEGPAISHTNSNASRGGVPGISSSRSRDVGKDFTQTPAMEIMPRSAFQAPPRRGESASVVSGASGNGRSMIATVPSEEMERTTKGKNPLEQPLLTKKAEQRVSQIKEKMKDPDTKLSDLIAHIATPEDHRPEDQFSRAYIVRRKNACGALQVLTAKSVHRIQICWTLGVLPALSSVLEDSGTRDLAVEYPEVTTRKEFIEARKRAVSALMNLSVPPENRLAVFHTPRLVSNIVRVINWDQYEARKGCCAVLAQLAKTKENRLLMVQVPGLIDAITGVIEPKVIIVPPKVASEEASHEDDDDSTRTPDHDFALHDSFSHDGSTAGTGPTSTCSYTSGEGTKEKDSDGKYAVDVNAVHTHDSSKAARRYDEDSNKQLHGARLNIFALLSHLVKEKDNAYILARHKFLVDTLVEISKIHESPAHEHAVKLLTHLTRHRGNSKHIVFKMRNTVPALVKASFSLNDEARKHACFGLQNLAQDKPCRQELAITEDLLSALCVRIRQASDPEERLSAIHALKNLTDEPANLIPMTNTSECFATLMQIAHSSDNSVTEMMQFLGCDALATLSHWFRSIATSGQRIDLNKKGLKPGTDLFVPSMKIVTYEQWQ